MPPPVLLVVDEDREALADVEAQLVQRYGRDYSVEGLADPGEALRTLAELADVGEDVALVLAATDFAGTTGSHLLEHAHQLHSHAKRALLVSADVWVNHPTADAIRESMALGRIDFYVPRPVGSPDEASTTPSRASCWSGRGIGASSHRPFRSSARHGRVVPSS